MADSEFYFLLFDHERLKNFLIEQKLIISPENIERALLTCRNMSCTQPNKGFRMIKRKRKISTRKAFQLVKEGQDIEYLNCLQCKSCSTYLSPRTNGFLTYQDSLNRANCKLAPEKILQMIYQWTSCRSIADTIQASKLKKSTIIDWYNFCRLVCQYSNQMTNRSLGNGFGREGTETPIVVVQIDECLLRGKRLYNRGRMLLGNNNIPVEDIQEFNNIVQHDGQNVDQARNYGRRIQGPWIFGMAECTKNTNGEYKTGEVKLFIVERRDANTLLPLIRNNTIPGSMIWSDQWAAYNRIGENNNLNHETVNHSERFITDSGVHTQNIEREWAKLKLKLIHNMKGTSQELLQSHLDEYIWRSRERGELWDKFLKILRDAAEKYPISW